MGLKSIATDVLIRRERERHEGCEYTAEWPQEDTLRRYLSANQGKRPQGANPLAPRPQTFSLQNC